MIYNKEEISRPLEEIEGIETQIGMTYNKEENQVARVTPKFKN